MTVKNVTHPYNQAVAQWRIRSLNLEGITPIGPPYMRPCCSVPGKIFLQLRNINHRYIANTKCKKGDAITKQNKKNEILLNYF